MNYHEKKEMIDELKENLETDFRDLLKMIEEDDEKTVSLILYIIDELKELKRLKAF